MYKGKSIHPFFCQKNKFHLFVSLGGFGDLDAAVWKVRTSDAHEEGL